MALHLFSVVLVLIGAVILGISFLKIIKIRGNVAGQIQRQWEIITWLTVLFIFGYLIFDSVLILKLDLPIELVTGCVFLGGAVFVFIIMGLFQRTLDNLVQSKSEIKEIKDDWEKTFDSVTDIITIHDMDFNIVRANQMAKETLGIQKGGHDHKCFQLYHGTDTPIGCPSCQAIQTGNLSSFEFFEPNLDKYLEIRVMPKYGDDGRQVGNIHIARDITLRKRMEKERQKLEDQLRQANKMQSLGTLAGGIAHDFNNLLMSMMGYTQMALIDLKENKLEEKELENILVAGNRAKELIRQILAFARRSNESSSRRRVSLKSVVQEVLTLLRPSIPASIILKEDLQDDSFIKAEPSQMHQIVMNLCTNAVHAMEKNGGTLTVEVKTVVRVNNACTRPGEFIEMKLSDTGPGIPEEIIGSIFDPYFTTKAVGKGTGMGLAVVHGLVADYGGKVTVENAPGAGAIFTVCLPVAEKRTTDRSTES